MSAPRPPEVAETAAPEFFATQVAGARRFYLNLNPPRRNPLSVVCGGVERAAAGYEIRRSTFPYYSIEYVLRGRGTAVLRGRRHTLEAGVLFTYGPGISHHITGHRGEPLVKYFVDFTGKESVALLRDCGLTPGSVSRVYPPSELQSLFEELLGCGLRAGRGTPAICGKLLECIALKVKDSQAPMAGAETLAYATYRKACEHIQRHFRRLKTLEQISAECHVNNAYLCRLFRRYGHQTPYQYLLHLKMRLAAESMKRSGAMVKQVAEEAGFGDPFHFSRAFKAVFGVSPAAFRALR